MPTERLSLDPRSYLKDETSQKLAVNLADVAIEAGKKPIEERINTFTLRLVGNRVINPELGPEDVSVFYTDKTELDKKEKTSGEIIRDCLVNLPEGTLAIWFSPPNADFKFNLNRNYDEGRITVGFNHKGSTCKEMESYGIPTDSFTPDDLLHMAWRLSEFSLENYGLDEPEDLRERPIILEIPEGDTPWNLLKDYIPLPRVWEKIENGQALEARNLTLEAAIQVAPETFEKIRDTGNIDAWINAIRAAEQQMAKRGFEIDLSKLDCPTEINNSLAYSFSLTEINQLGEVTGVKLEFGKKWNYHKGNCVNPGCKAKDIMVGPCSICKKCEKVL